MLKNILINLLRLPFQIRRAGRESRMLPLLEPAVAVFNAGNFDETIRMCRSILVEEPQSAQANHLCGRALIELGRHVEAESFLKLAVHLAPDLAEAHADLSAVLLQAADYADAEVSCRRAVSIEPTEVRYRLRLVEILESAGRERDALAELAMAQECAPDQLDLLLKVCAGLDRKNRHLEMRRLAERAVMESGETFETLSCLAVACHGMDDMPAAINACRKALLLRPEQAEIHVTLGSALFDSGNVDDAVAALRRALKLNRESVAAHYNLGLINLMRGKYREGWEQFDYRFRLPKNRSWRACEPRWNGSTLRGRTLLVMREQGLGDEIMYASCYGDVITSAKKCIFECDPRLEPLLSRSFPDATFLPLQDLMTRVASEPGVPVDVRSYAGSLPRFLRGSLRDFPRHQGYLKADPQRIQDWRDRLNALGEGLKVGISWRGGTLVTKRGRRSFALNDLLPLLTVPGVQWVNLQYGERSDDIARLQSERGIKINDWPEAIDGGYDETAALVSALDLVISVCTSVIHLTGALGKPAWVLAPRVPEWRYGLAGKTMPWYPSVQLFRQPGPDAWEPVIHEVREQLLLKVATGAV
jgi:tetratricopeptide (TPR) repeat protein